MKTRGGCFTMVRTEQEWVDAMDHMNEAKEAAMTLIGVPSVVVKPYLSLVCKLLLCYRAGERSEILFHEMVHWKI